MSLLSSFLRFMPILQLVYIAVIFLKSEFFLIVLVTSLFMSQGKQKIKLECHSGAFLAGVCFAKWIEKHEHKEVVGWWESNFTVRYLDQAQNATSYETGKLKASKMIRLKTNTVKDGKVKTRISSGTWAYKLIYFFRSVAARTMHAGPERNLSSSLQVISCTTLTLKPYNNQYIIISFHFEDFIPTDND